MLNVLFLEFNEKCVSNSMGVINYYCVKLAPDVLIYYTYGTPRIHRDNLLQKSLAFANGIN
jgi:hypothetical protein